MERITRLDRAGKPPIQVLYVRDEVVSGEHSWENDLTAGVSAGDSVTLEEGNELVNDPGGEEIKIVFETDSSSDTLDTLTVADI